MERAQSDSDELRVGHTILEFGLILIHLFFDFFFGTPRNSGSFNRRGTEQTYYVQDTWTSERLGLSLTGGGRLQGIEEHVELGLTRQAPRLVLPNHPEIAVGLRKIECAGDVVPEVEVAGALAACLAESSTGIGRELGLGSVQSAILEYERGTLLLHRVGRGALVAVLVADATALGKVRYLLKKALPGILQEL